MLSRMNCREIAEKTNDFTFSYFYNSGKMMNWKFVKYGIEARDFDHQGGIYKKIKNGGILFFQQLYQLFLTNI